MNQYNDIRSGDRSELASLQAAFFNSGGQIEQLEPFKFAPRPLRIEPTVSPEEQERRAFIEKVREMAKTMTKHDMAAALEVTHHRIYVTCKAHRIESKSGIENQVATLRANAAKRASAAALDKERLVERVRALAEVGLTRIETYKKVGISRRSLKRLIDDYHIEFPGPPK